MKNNKQAYLFVGAVNFVLFVERNWFGGTLSGPKRPIFHHAQQIFLTVALLRPAKIRFIWQKMTTFCLRRDHANQLLWNKYQQISRIIAA
jgi:hypothetical protein